MASLNILGIGDEEPGNLLSLSPPLSDGTPRGVQQIPERDALAALYNNVTALIERPTSPGLLRPSWNPSNPVGTERVREQYLTNPDLDVVPGVKWGESWVSPQNAAGLNRAQAIGEGFAGSASPGKGLLGLRAYHGSPHSFERFDSSYIGTGEGNQAYGRGLYFAEREGVAKGYRDTLTAQHQVPVTDPASGRVYKPGDPYYEDAVKMYGSPGSMYEVNIAANPEHMLHWDKPLSEQPEIVAKLKAAGIPVGKDLKQTGSGLYDTVLHYDTGAHPQTGRPDAVELAARLKEAGIPGIRYRDQGSRHAPKLSDAERQQLQAAIADKQRLIADPRQHRDLAMHQADLDLFQRRLSGAEDVSHNLVVFDDATIEILRKYGLAGLMLGGGGAAAGSQGSDRQ